MSRMIPGKRKRERDLKKLSIPSAIRFLDKENCLREADPIDLNDGGDTPFRRLCFDLLWKLRRS